MSSNVQSEYIEEIAAWRRERDEELRKPDGWLSLTGLFVLTDGIQTIGSDPANDIVLPATAPGYLGAIAFHHGKASLKVTSPEPVFVDGAPARSAELVDNGDHKQPTLITAGTVTFFIHRFGDQYAVRVKDSTNPAILAFPGRTWFEVKPEYRVTGRFRPYASTQSLQILTSVNTPVSYDSVGTIEFELHGQVFDLLATATTAANQLSIVFRDATAGEQTYAAARFLTATLNADGAVEVDFNKAYNPPCAFTPYATCPLPPRDNILPVSILAGEMVNSATGHNKEHGAVTISAD